MLIRVFILLFGWVVVVVVVVVFLVFGVVVVFWVEFIVSCLIKYLVFGWSMGVVMLL